MVDERIARRRAEVRAGRRAARLRRTLLVALLLTITGAGVWFERSEYATVVEVRVAGVDRLDVTTVMERAVWEWGTQRCDYGRGRALVASRS